MLDYLVIGFGLAGLSFTETALQKGKSCFVIDSENNYSSRVAPGLYNPVILKRFSVAWKADEQLDCINYFYQNLEKQFAKRYYFPLPIYRKLFSVEEQNNWFVAADRPILSSFLSPRLITHKINTNTLRTEMPVCCNHRRFLVEKCLTSDAWSNNEL